MLFLIGFNRYIFVCQQAKYKSMFTKTKTTAILIYTLLSCIFLSIFPLIWPQIFGQLIFRDYIKMCLYDLDNYVYFVMASTYAATIPFYGCIFSYYKIFQLVYKTKKAIRDKTQKSQFQVYKSLLIIFGAYMVTQVPVGIIVIDKLNLMKMPVRLFQISLHCLELNAIINPWILGLTNPDFKFKWLNEKKNKVQPVPVATGKARKVKSTVAPANQ